jgi:hypothetical protein
MTSRVDFQAAAGTTYQIAADGARGDAGFLVLNWNMESRLGIFRLPDGHFQILLTGVNWQRYTLFGTTDLLNWFTNVPTVTMSGDRHSYTNSNVSPHQFYRARRSP